MCLAVAGDYANELMEGFVPARAGMFVQPVVDSMKEGVAHFIAQTAEEIAVCLAPACYDGTGGAWC
jgi:hypothetical protein